MLPLRSNKAKLAVLLPVAGTVLLVWWFEVHHYHQDVNIIISSSSSLQQEYNPTESTIHMTIPTQQFALQTSQSKNATPSKEVISPSIPPVPPLINFSFAVCHDHEVGDDEHNTPPGQQSKGNTIIVGAMSFIGAGIARVFHQMSIPVIASEDYVNMGFEPLAWYRWEQLIGMGVSPQFMNYNNRDMTTSFIKKHSLKTIVYVPTPLVEGEESNNVRQIFDLHSNFLQMLEILRKEYPSTRIILVSISEPKGSYAAMIKLFELSLSVYNNLYGIRMAIVRTKNVYGPWQNSDAVESNSYFIDDLAKQVQAFDSQDCIVKDISQLINQHTSTGVSATEKWKAEYSQYRYAQTKGVIASTYITTKRNAQYAIEFNNNNYAFMEPWFTNIYKMNLSMAVFHDALSENFVSTFKSSYSKSDFIKMTSFKSLSPNDARFSAYYEYILKHPEIQYFVMTDMRDVLIQNNPFEVLETIGDFLYVGIDEPTRLYPAQSYLPRLFMRCFPRFKLNYNKELKMLGFLNAGVIGGSRSVVLAFLTRFFQILDISTKQNCNMGVVEYVFHKYFFDDLYYGWPFNAAFLTKQPNIPGLAVLHKWTLDSYT